MKLKKRFLYAKYILGISKSPFKQRRPREIFTSIYQNNYWNGDESLSGPGSSKIQTLAIREALPQIFRDFGIKKILDIPCGDFNWMQNVDLENLDYIGADIVEELISKNQQQFGAGSINFMNLDITNDKLPKVDLVICRDCFVHFSCLDISRALKNIVDSKSSFLLTTSFINEPFNYDIHTGDWRPINLQKDPFYLPSPVLVLNENCTTDNDQYNDKSLCLWDIQALKSVIREYQIHPLKSLFRVLLSTKFR